MTKNILALEMRKVLILSASFLLFFQACKEEGDLNPEFADNTTAFLFSDTVTVHTFTETGDTILADNISTGLVGAYKDSAFGTSIASIHIQPLLPSNFLVFKEDGEVITTDSVVLSLEYNGAYGNIDVQQTIDVFRIDEELSSSTSYYSNSTIQTQSSVLGTKTFFPNVDSSVTVIRPNQFGGADTVRLSPQLRIRLDNSLGDEILSQSGQDPVASSENFIKLLKGLKITPSASSVPSNNNENAILYFALTSSNTKLTIYYNTKAAGDTNSIQKSVDFPINSSSVRFNTFNHDYTGSAVEMAIQNNSYDSQVSYTLAMAGAQTLIKFPDFKQNFENKNLSINKAELYIPAISGNHSTYGFASSIIVATKNESGELQFLPDFFEGTSYFGGQFEATSNSYRFNITRYIQGLINGTQNENGLVLLVSGSAVKAERLVLYGADNSTNRIKLNLYYSNTN